MRTLYFSILITLFLFIPLTAETGAFQEWPSLEELTGHLTSSQKSELAETGELIASIEEDVLLSLPPGGESDELETLRSRMRRSYGIETLLFLPMDGIEEQDNLMVDLYNIFRGVSSLEGADYYSVSKKRRRTLFHKFHAIADQNDLTPMEDPIYSELPGEEEFLIFQEDSTFGESVHRMRYRTDDKSITLTMENLDPLKLLFFTVADPEELIMLARIVPTKEGILFYGLCQAEGGGVPGMKDRTAKSLGNRVKALFEWFTRQTVNL